MCVSLCVCVCSIATLRIYIVAVAEVNGGQRAAQWIHTEVLRIVNQRAASRRTLCFAVEAPTLARRKAMPLECCQLGARP